MTPPGARATSRSAQPLAVAFRYLIVVGVLVAAAGVAGRYLSWPLLTATIGPTAYVFASHPRTETSRLRNAVIGHGVAVGAGLAAVALFGLWHHPSVSALGAPSLSQVAAAALAAAATMSVLELVHLHHAPAAASALLVATGLAKPGAPLIGLVLGLAIVIVLGPLLAQVPFTRAEQPGDPRPAPPEETAP